MQTFLVPLGNLDDGINNLKYALEFAKAMQARLLVAKLYKEIPRAGNLAEGNLSLREITEQDIREELDKHGSNYRDVSALPLEGEDWVDAVAHYHQQENVDLILLPPHKTSLNDDLYLGTVSGGFVKQTEIPVLIVGNEYEFQPIKRVLMAVKSGHVKNKEILKPIKAIKKSFEAELRLLQVKTPRFLPEDAEFDTVLGKIVDCYKSTENATLFQGVLEHLNENNPDMICVFRRKRGFFAKLWDEGVIRKSDFESRIPLLILKEAI
ncbi:universal stress protein [Croceiramulus getboli]|nr:universal stress protein [Flavobacteriaceae bacterium YJPT1-3]